MGAGRDDEAADQAAPALPSERQAHLREVALDAEAAQAGLQARLGADLPWGHLRYWMLGLAAPGDAAVQESGAAPWRVIEQAGWRLAYESFAAVQGVNLPKRFSAERGTVKVRVIVDRWSPGQTVPAAPESLR